MNSAYFSHPKPGKENEDSVLPPFSSNTLIVSAIADGIGGSTGGAIASKIATSTVSEFYSNNVEGTFEELFEKVRGALEEYSKENSGYENMGTTLSVLVISGNVAKVGHVGDTRIYHLRGSGILRRTQDQTEVQKLLDEGILSKTSAMKYPRKNVLYSALTPVRNYQLYKVSFDIEANDRITLLSDGISKVIGLKEFQNLSETSKSVEEFKSAVENLISTKGSIDDYSAVFLQI
jgi:serine/threonine protein phosphatase PrpC